MLEALLTGPHVLFKSVGSSTGAVLPSSGKANTGHIVPSCLFVYQANFLTFGVSESVAKSTRFVLLTYWRVGVSIAMTTPEWHSFFELLTRSFYSGAQKRLKLQHSLQLSSTVFTRVFASFPEAEDPLGFLRVVVSRTHAQKSYNLDAIKMSARQGEITGHRLWVGELEKVSRFLEFVLSLEK